MTKTFKKILMAGGISLVMTASASAALAGNGNGNNGNGNNGNGNNGNGNNGNGGPPPAAVPGACAITDIVAAPAGSSCAGYYAGNALGNSAAKVGVQTTALNSLGLAGAPNQVEHILLNDAPLIDFATPLYGATYIGVHWGAGAGGPGVGIPGGVTGFYKLNFSSNANIDQIFSSYRTTNSTAVLFSTQGAPPTTAIPEPATWAMMIIGFGTAGSLLRRRRSLATA